MKQNKAFQICDSDTEPEFVAFYLENLPEPGPNFAERLAHSLRFSSVDQMCNLQLPPVVALCSEVGDSKVIYGGDVISVAVLGRCSEGLFFRRRRLSLYWELLSKRYFVFRSDIAVGRGWRE